MADELGLPAIPEAAPEDPEDVSWALSTAEAMWARGDHLEGIKWVRRAAEAASEAERDERALHLAKAAADLSGLIARRSAVPNQEVDVPKPAPAPAAPAGSVKPAPPLPSKLGQKPSASAAPRPTRPAAPKPIEKKGRRRSKENLEAEARAAGVADASNANANNADTTEVPALERPVESARVSRSAAPPPPPVPTPPRAEPSAIELTSSEMKSADDWDASPTQSLSDEELAKIAPGVDGDRSTVLGAPPSGAPMRPPSPTQHDPGIRTSQAVRVIVWRDAAGVHIAPEGTRVSALTIDAVLVALEPSADLTAWLSERE